MIPYEVISPSVDYLFSHVYAAKILGADPNYVLRRSFQRPTAWAGEFHTHWEFVLDDGIYEIGIVLYDSDSGDRVYRKRYWLVVYDGIDYAYPYEEMTSLYVRYTAWLIQLHSREERRLHDKSPSYKVLYTVTG